MGKLAAREAAFAFLCGMASLLFMPSLASAASVTYDFNSDTAGQVPANTTVATGTLSVANQATLGNSLHATAANGQSAGIIFNNFASTTDYSVTWRAAYVSSGARDGFILRAQSGDAFIQAGVRQGYLFQVNKPGASGVANTVRIYRLTSGASTQLVSAAFTNSTPEYFRAMVVGNQLGFYSSSDGVTFTIIAASSTDSTFSGGGVEYVAGFVATGPNGSDYVDDVTQTTYGAGADVTPPIISSIATSTTSASATITWTTDESADSQINYGTTSSYTASSTYDGTLLTSHSQTISGLAPSTTYHFRVRSADSSGNLSVSSDNTFTTAAAAPPVISAVASSTAATTATITWSTDSASDSQINYGLTSSYTASSTYDSTLVTSHSQTITGLATSTLYHFRVRSADALSNLSVSNDFTFTTSAGASISVSNPHTYQVIQRDSASNKADIVITGTYTGTPTAIEASWNGGTYTTIAASPAGGTFSGTLANQSAGQGTLAVRFANDTTVSTTTAYVGVGDIFVVYGQSNADGRAPLASSATSTTGVIATFDSAGATDSTTGWAPLSDKNFTPQLANYLLQANPDVPIGFVKYAVGGTPIASFIPGQTFFTTLTNRINAAVSGQSHHVRGLLYYQGESDASSCTASSTYYADLALITDNLTTAYGGVGMIGVMGTDQAPTPNCADAIRQAQINIHTYTNNVPGPIAVDDRGDGLHYNNANSSSQLGYRWFQAITKYVYASSTMDANPKLNPDSIYYDSNSNKISLTFNAPAGFSTSTSLLDINNTGPGTVGLPSASAFNLFTNGTTTTYSTSSSWLSSLALGTTTGRVILTLGGSGSVNSTSTLSYCSGYNQNGTAAAEYTACAGGNSLYSANSFMPAYPFYNVAIQSLAAPSIPSGANATTDNSSVTLSWTPGSGATYTNIYNGSAFIASTTGSSYTVTGLSSNTAYTFKLESANAGWVSPQVSVTATTTAAPSFGGAGAGGGGSPSVPIPPIASGATSTPSGNAEPQDSDSQDNPSAPSDDSQDNPSQTSAPTYGRDLMFGASGADVSALQRFLLASGYSIPAGATGYFGIQTQNALSLYQKDNGIVPASGYFGPLTRAGIGGNSSGSTGNSLQPSLPSSGFQFTQNLQLNDHGEDVRQLQAYLNSHGFPVKETGPGSSGNETDVFGPGTYAALVRFQNAHVSDILAPVGLTAGNGYFGSSTRAYVNAH